ncbi:hypothetical protein JTE90_024685 [Oedothorax gibbosus]|uniref:Reverse transcriptase domain-containing protein n=1 Tax=Oedothorax gibbosus TaxID=931172 RepID=A0AAV6TU82_9ARAC|nr:hypothetical protein JTE90_024685 [Oedothorax gibbosus]
MSELLKDVDNVECSMDDILIFANSKAELNEVVDKVMKRLFLAGLKLNKEKCVLSAEKVKFLGHILDENGVSPDPEKSTRKDNSDIALALLNVRNTPREAGLMSINQRLMSRTTRSLLPSTTSSLKPRVVEDATESLGLLREKKTAAANRHIISQQSPPSMNPGEDVRVQAGPRKWVGGKIEEMVNPRSAIIKVGDKTIRRNTIHVHPTSAELPPPFKSSINFQSNASCPATPTRREVVHSFPPSTLQMIKSPEVRTRSGSIVKPIKRLNL